MLCNIWRGTEPGMPAKALNGKDFSVMVPGIVLVWVL